MFCLTRDKPIRLPDDDADDLLEQVYEESAREKYTLPRRAEEDEMQQRLADLRKQVTSAGLDW